MRVETYLMFNGRCEEALEFYQQVLGAKVGMMLRIKDSPEPPAPGMVPEGMENKVMHSSFTVGETTVMASDGRCQGTPNFQGFSLSLALEDDESANRVFKALSRGGEVQMPLAETFFASKFGMVADKFGVSWMVIVQLK